jgi:phosphatidylglycerophosphate synthase
MPIRKQGWLQALARSLAARGVTPNAVSVTSILVSVLAGGCLAANHWTPAFVASALLVTAAALVGLRGICNLVDGMIAIEGGQKTPSGEVFNDFPDRVSDIALFVGAGYGALEAAWAIPLGWSCAVLAVLVAYTRMLGGATGATQYFTGPMAKPVRMGVIAAAAVAASIERLFNHSSWSLVIGLSIIALGCVWTTARRVRQIVRELEAA